jgi:CxxC motif-containing protein
MKATANVEVEAPVKMGQIVLQNICGADLVTTRKVKRVVLSSPTYL